MYVPADAIPESVTADVAALNFNDSLHISAIKLPEGCRPTITGRDFTIASITPPTTMPEETAAAAEGAAPAVAAPAAASPVEAKPAAPTKGGAAPAAPAAPAGKK
jgi:large subunit ribosomal protein L25